MKNKTEGLRTRTKLMISILPIVIISFMLLICIAFISSKSSIQEKTGKLLQAEGKASEKSIQAWMNDNIGTLQNATDTIINLQMKDPDILTYESFYLETYKDFPNGIYMIYDTGKVLDATGWEPDGDATQKSYYKEGLSHPSVMFGAPYLDELTGEYVVTASRFTNNLNGKGAVFCTDISLAILTEVVNAVDVVGEGDTFIFDADSATILAHQDASLVAENMSEMKDPFYNRLLSMVAGAHSDIMSIKASNGSYMVNMQPIEGTNWYIVTRALEKNIYKDIYTLGIILSIVGMIVVALLSVIIVVMINRVTGPIVELTDTVTDISNQIDVQAKNSNQISHILHDSAEGQASSMGQLLDNLQELVKTIGIIADNATNLAVVAAETNDNGSAALEDMNNTILVADNGRNSMESVTVAMKDVTDAMTALESSIGEVSDTTVKINEIIGTIGNIAMQTNILSLNARVEASRAGMAGQGFAVVAEEIKNLAETTAHSAEEIAQLIELVTTRIEDTVEQSNRSMKQISSSASLVGNATEQFQNIYDHISGTNGMINRIIEQIHTLNDVASNMAAITEQQSASASEIENNAVNTQQLAIDVSEKSAKMEKDSLELADTAELLKNHVSQFTI